VVRRRISSFAGPSLAAWLYGITRKTVSDYRRRAWVRRLFSGKHRSLDALSAAEQVSGVDAVERWEARRILQRVFEQMSHVRRSAFILFEIEGYSGEEIAELEQIPVATVYTRLHHARRDFLRLTAAMTGQGAQDLPDAHEPKDPPS
jgi:RNA polymerase sigma-70 factor (ECF subfamily)